MQNTRTLTYYHDPGDHKRRARERRLDELVQEAGRKGDILDRGYWELVYDNEEAPFTTDAAELRAAGFELPESSSLDDDALAVKLNELLLELDRMGVTIFDHEHVPGRELYELLTGKLLHEERRDIPMPPGGMWTIDIGMVRPREEDELY